MEIRYHLYTAAQIVAAFVGVGGAAATGAGIPSRIAPELVPMEQRFPVAGALLAAATAGWIVFARLRVDRWRAVGRAAGLSLDAGGDASRLRAALGTPLSADPLPDLAGTVDGRTVRASTYRVSTGGGGDGSSGSTEEYTVVAAELDAPTDASAIVGPATAEGEDIDAMLPGSVETTALGSDLVMLGDAPEAFADEMRSGAGGRALVGLDEPVGVTVGDATDAIMDALGDELSTAMAFLPSDRLEERFREHPANDAGTVAVNNEGVLLDADRLAEQAEAAAAVAGAVEQAGLTETGSELGA